MLTSMHVPTPEELTVRRAPPSIRACGHAARLSLSRLRAQLGGDYPVRKVREKLRCQQCNDRRQIVVTFLAPDQRTGNLSHLFNRPLHRR